MKDRNKPVSKVHSKKTTPRQTSKPVVKPVETATADFDTSELKYWFSVMDGSPVPIKYENLVEQQSCGFETVSLLQAIDRFDLPKSLLTTLWETKFTDQRFAWIPTPARVETPPAVTNQGTYWPELDFWEYKHVTGNEFTINATMSAGSAPLIATVKINPALKFENAKRIANLMASSPEIWQVLQDSAPNLLDECFPSEKFSVALDTLWQSSGRFPFHWPRANKEEDDLAVEGNEAVRQQIGGKANEAIVNVR